MPFLRDSRTVSFYICKAIKMRAGARGATMKVPWDTVALGVGMLAILITCSATGSNGISPEIALVFFSSFALALV